MFLWINKILSSVIVRSVSVTFFDQLTVSFVQFFIGCIFIYSSTPEEYGIYSFFISLYYWVASNQNAIINTPIMVLQPRMTSPIQRAMLMRGMIGLLALLSLCLLIIGMITTFCFKNYLAQKAVTVQHVLWFYFALFPLLLRDFFRANDFANLHPIKAFWRDFSYLLVFIFLVGMNSIFYKIDSKSVFMIMGVAAIIVTLKSFASLIVPLPTIKEITYALQQSWKISVWSFWGANSSSLRRQAFVYLPFFMLGVKEIAYLSAARLVMQPVALLSASWGNYIRPLASKAISSDNLKRIIPVFIKSTVIILLIVISYALVVLSIFHTLPPSWIPENYRHTENYILFWSLIIFISTIAGSFSYFYQASLYFKSLAIVSMLATFFTIIISYYLIKLIGVEGTLAGRIAGEIFRAFSLAAILKWISSRYN